MRLNSAIKKLIKLTKLKTHLYHALKASLQTILHIFNMLSARYTH